jgi:hypothetical protein
MSVLENVLATDGSAMVYVNKRVESMPVHKGLEWFICVLYIVEWGLTEKHSTQKTSGRPNVYAEIINFLFQKRLWRFISWCSYGVFERCCRGVLISLCMIPFECKKSRPVSKSYMKNLIVF